MSDDPKPHVLVGMPCYGGQMYYTTTHGCLAISQAFQQLGWNVTFYFFGNESLVQRARNRVVSHFVASTATHLLFIDSDIGFEVNDVIAMVQSDFDVVAGAYPKKEILWEKVRNAAYRGVEAKDLPMHGASHVLNLTDDTYEGKPTTFCTMRDLAFVEVKDAGTGFMLIKRHVIEKMMAAYPELEYKPDSGELYGSPPFALFDCLIEPETRRYLSEDYTFCRRWQKLGGKVYSYLSGRLTHTGTHTFTGGADVMLGLRQDKFDDLPVTFVDVKELDR